MYSGSFADHKMSPFFLQFDFIVDHDTHISVFLSMLGRKSPLPGIRFITIQMQT